MFDSSGPKLNPVDAQRILELAGTLMCCGILSFLFGALVGSGRDTQEIEAELGLLRAKNHPELVERMKSLQQMKEVQERARRFFNTAMALGSAYLVFAAGALRWPFASWVAGSLLSLPGLLLFWILGKGALMNMSFLAVLGFVWILRCGPASYRHFRLKRS